MGRFMPMAARCRMPAAEGELAQGLDRCSPNGLAAAAASAGLQTVRNRDRNSPGASHTAPDQRPGLPSSERRVGDGCVPARPTPARHSDPADLLWCSRVEQIEQAGIAELLPLDCQRPVQARQGCCGSLQLGAGGCGAQPLFHVAAQQLLEGDTLISRPGFQPCEQRIRIKDVSILVRIHCVGILGLHNKEPLQQVLQMPAGACRARILSSTRRLSPMEPMPPPSTMRSGSQ